MPIVSEHDVMQAAQTLIARGERVTGKNLRKEIGHGDQVRLLRIWNGVQAREADAACIAVLPDDLTARIG